MSALDLLTKSVTSRARSGNPLELLPPRARAVVTLLGSGMDATTVAKLLSISRETLYQDRRRAWRALTPVIPGRVLSEYEANRRPPSRGRVNGQREAAMADYPLGSLGVQIREHWKRHRPKMYAELEKRGHLAESLYAAQERTSDAMYELTVVKKLPYDQAWELVREEWAFLPSEEDDAEHSDP